MDLVPLVPTRSRRSLTTLAASLALSLACALPGQPVRVLPGLSGEIAGDAKDVAGTRLVLVVLHRESPSLHARERLLLAPDGRFRFEPVLLDVAGHEFSKHYRVYLHLETVRSGSAPTSATAPGAPAAPSAASPAASDRVIWRADLSRLDDPTPIRLDCDLARPIALGEPCRVVDPLAQPWLVAEGKRNFERLCADCHGRDARGLPPATTGSGTARSPAVPDLTRIAARRAGRFDRDAVAAFIEGRSLPPGHVRGDMPVWGERLSGEFERYAEGDELIGATLEPLLAYLESLQTPD